MSNNITQLVFTKDVGKHRIFGTSIDIGIGNCFDKVFFGILKFRYILKDSQLVREIYESIFIIFRS